LQTFLFYKNHILILSFFYNILNNVRDLFLALTISNGHFVFVVAKKKRETAAGEKGRDGE